MNIWGVFSDHYEHSFFNSKEGAVKFVLEEIEASNEEKEILNEFLKNDEDSCDIIQGYYIEGCVVKD